MSGSKRERWLPIVFAVGLHALIAAAFVYGWMLWKPAPPPPQALAIDATVVDSHSLDRVTAPTVEPSAPAPAEPPTPTPTPTPPTPTPTPEPTPAPPPQPEPAPPPPAPTPPPPAPPEPVKPPPPPEATAKPKDSPTELERAAEAQHKAAQQKAAADKAAAQKAAAEKAAAEKLAQQKVAAEKAAAAAAAAVAAKAKAQAEARAEAERQALEAQQRAATEADLRRSLAQEEHVAVASGQKERWIAEISARITRAWIRPPSAKPGIDCVVHVTQVPGGEVVSAKVGACNGDDAVRLSIEAAVLRASPLPLPPDPALFDRDLEVRFRPD